MKALQILSNIENQFIKIQERIENIASISEEHSASNEEILATIENQNNDIVAINTSIQEIKEMSRVLNDLMHR